MQGALHIIPPSGFFLLETLAGWYLSPYSPYQVSKLCLHSYFSSLWLTPGISSSPMLPGTTPLPSFHPKSYMLDIHSKSPFGGLHAAQTRIKLNLSTSQSSPPLAFWLLNDSCFSTTNTTKPGITFVIFIDFCFYPPSTIDIASKINLKFIQISPYVLPITKLKFAWTTDNNWHCLQAVCPSGF